MKTYSEREIAAIIERAAERQAEADRREGAPGLTLEEIEALGREAGIDPAHLRAAAEEIGTHGRVTQGEAGQTRTHVHVERWVDGPLTDDAWEDTVAHLRQSFGAEMSAAFGLSGAGEVQQVGQSYEWSHTSSLGVQTRVTVSPRGDRTRLRITQLVGLSSPTVEGIGYGLAIAFFLTILASGAAAAFDLGGAVVTLTSVLTFLVTALIGIPTVTRLDRSWRAKKLRQLGELADDLAPILTAPASHPTQTRDAGRADAQPALDLDLLPDEAPSEAGRTERSRVR